MFDVFSVKTKYNITVNTGKKTLFLVNDYSNCDDEDEDDDD